MQIWSAEIKELVALYSSIEGSVPELDKELSRLIKSEHENLILLVSEM